MNTLHKLPKRLTLPEPENPQRVSQWRHDLATFCQNVALNIGMSQVDAGQVATGAISFISNPADGDTVAVTIDTEAVIYEFDSNATVGAGHVTVPIGGSSAVTATNLAAVMAAQSQRASLTATQHATDTTVIDLVGMKAGAPLTITESTGGVRLSVQDTGNEREQTTLYWFAQRREVTAHDVLRARIVFNTGMQTVVWWNVVVQTSPTEPLATGFDGEVLITGGVIEVENTGSTDFALGQMIVVIAAGVQT